MTEIAENEANTSFAISTKPVWRRVVDFPLVALLIALLGVAAVLGAAFLLFKVWPEWLDPNLDGALRTIIMVAAFFALSKLVLRHLGENPRDDLPLKRALPELGLGLLGGGVLITMIVGVAATLGVYRIVGWGGSTDAMMIFFQAGIFAGFVEEVISRGILFRWIEEFGGSWAALAISSLIFGFLHAGNQNATLFSSVAISIEAGILLGAAYMVTRSLWLAVGLHASWNVVQGYFWDVPVSGHQVDGMVDSRYSGPELLSGGAFGLEASVIALVIATSAGIWLLRIAFTRGHIVQPWWVRRRQARADAEI